MDNIIIVGAGGHAVSCIDVIENENLFKIIGLVDSKSKKHVSGYPIIGNDNDLTELRKKCKNIIISIGQIHEYQPRAKLYNQLKSLNFKLPIIKSPRSYVSNKSKIGEGTIIMHDVIVNANSIIGKNCIINNKSLVEHDVEVGDNCHISTGSIINGNCIVGDNTFIGSGSTIVNGQKIPPQSFIKAGTRYYNKENKE